MRKWQKNIMCFVLSWTATIITRGKYTTRKSRLVDRLLIKMDEINEK